MNFLNNLTPNLFSSSNIHCFVCVSYVNSFVSYETVYSFVSYVRTDYVLNH